MRLDKIIKETHLLDISPEDFITNTYLCDHVTRNQKVHINIYNIYYFYKLMLLEQLIHGNSKHLEFCNVSERDQNDKGRKKN